MITPQYCVIPIPSPMQKVDCDRQRQELREGLTALRRSGQGNVWLLRPGGITIKTTPEQARAIMEKGEQVIGGVMPGMGLGMWAEPNLSPPYGFRV